MKNIRASFLNKHSRLAGMFILFICLLVGGVWSVAKGQDISFDLLNYHLYLPYAFLHGRYGQDFIVSGAIHSFFNPLADIPYYLLFVHLNAWPRLTAFVQGLWYGLFLFFSWKICVLLFPHFRAAQAKLLRLTAFLFSVTGMATAGQAGMSSNEVMLAAGQLAAFYGLLKANPAHPRASYYWAAAAFLCSAMAGLKYTCVPACVGLGAAGWWLWWKYNHRWKVCLLCAACGMAGFLLTAGYFMWRNSVWTGNPFFPYFNALFHSPFFAWENLSNGWAVPSTFTERILLPFTRLNFVLEFRVDWRIMLGYVAAFVLLLRNFLCRDRRKWGRLQQTRFQAVWLVFVGTYIAWVYLFASMRYGAMLEFCGALLLVYVLRQVFGAVNGSVLAVVVAVFVCLQPLPEWSRQGFLNKNHILFQQPQVEDDALVLLGGHVSFLVLSFNPKASYVGGIWFHPEDFPQKTPKQLLYFNVLQTADYQHRFDGLIRQKVCQHKGPLYVLGPWTEMMWQPAMWERYGVHLKDVPQTCRFFNSSLNTQWKGFVICPAYAECS